MNSAIPIIGLVVVGVQRQRNQTDLVVQDADVLWRKNTIDMTDYWTHPNLSNSDMKRFKQSLNGGMQIEPERLKEIFDFGSLFHKIILEPNLVTEEDKQAIGYVLACKMGKRFFKDPLCRMFINSSDFRREAEFYETIEVGGMRYNAKCKCDGHRLGLKSTLELKGLAINNEKSFKEALVRLDYDQAAVHYMLTSKTNMFLFVGISKNDPELLFTKVVKKHDDFYAIGEQKLIDTLRQLRQFSPEDVQLVA